MQKVVKYLVSEQFPRAWPVTNEPWSHSLRLGNCANLPQGCLALPSPSIAIPDFIPHQVLPELINSPDNRAPPVLFSFLIGGERGEA